MSDYREFRMSSESYFYLAGKMRGVPEFNASSFRAAASALRSRGLEIVSPLEMDESDGFDWSGFSGNEDLSSLGFDLGDRLLEDLRCVRASSGVIAIEGWETSSGALAEVHLAWALGLPVLEYQPPNAFDGHHCLVTVRSIHEAGIPGRLSDSPTVVWGE